MINSKSPKTASRSKTWREVKEAEIKVEEEKLKIAEEEIGELVDEHNGLFGALAQKNGKLNQLATYKKQYLLNNFPKFFGLDQKDKDLTKELKGCQNSRDRRDKKARYLGKLIKCNESHEKILAIMKSVSEKLSIDINNNNKK